MNVNKTNYDSLDLLVSTIVTAAAAFILFTYSNIYAQDQEQQQSNPQSTSGIYPIRPKFKIRSSSLWS